MTDETNPLQAEAQHEETQASVDAPFTTPTGEPVRNPIGFYKSEAEKYQRLLKTYEAKATELETTLTETQARVVEIEAQLETERLNRLAETKKARLVMAGLDADMLEFVTANDDEGIKSQIAKLAEKVASKPKVQPRTGNGNVQSNGGKPEWLDSRNSISGGGYKVSG